MDCFYVQVEQVRDPNLRGVPTAVCQYNPFGDLSTLGPDDNRRVESNGSLIAVGYEARASGVKRSMRGYEAKRACPNLILVQVPVAHGKADINIYRKAGEKVVNTLSKRYRDGAYRCIVEKASIDEVYLDLTEEASRMLVQCTDFKSEIVDKLDHAVIRIATGDVGRGGSRSGVGGASSISSVATTSSGQSHSSSGNDEHSTFPLSALQEVSDVDNILEREPHPQFVGDEEAEYSVSSFSSLMADEDEDEDAGVQSATVGIDAVDAGESSGRIDVWPFNQTDWNSDEDSSDAALLRGDKLLLCGALMVQLLRQDVLRECGYTCSAGVAHTKMLSKIASAMNKPNKQTLVPSRCVPQLMESLPLKKLRGFGGKLGTALKEQFDVKVAGDITALGEAGLSSKYDRSQCNWMLQAARGDLDDQVTPRILPSILSCGKTYRGRAGLPLIGLEDGTILKWLHELSAELLERLDEAKEGYNRIARTIGVSFSLQYTPSSSGDGSELAPPPPSRSKSNSPDRIKASPSKGVPPSSVALSKNCPMPRNSSLESLANLFLKLMTTTIENSKKVHVNTAGGWRITYMFLHASGFDTIASEKQRISHFFSSSAMANNSYDKREKNNSLGNAPTDAGVASDSHISRGIFDSADDFPDVPPKCNEESLRVDAQNYTTTRHTDSPSSASSAIDQKPLPASLDHEGNVCSYISPPDSCDEYAHQESNDSTGVAPAHSELGVPESVSESCSIDMDVLKSLPADIQRELVAHYKLDVVVNRKEGVSKRELEGGESSSPFNHGRSIRVRRDQTVASVLNDRIKRKNGLHRYLVSKK